MYEAFNTLVFFFKTVNTVLKLTLNLSLCSKWFLISDLLLEGHNVNMYYQG